MPKIEKSITINAPVEKVFNYANDPMNQLEWLPSMTEIHDVTGSGVGTHFRWVYKMVGVRLAGESTITEHIPGKYNSGLIYPFLKKVKRMTCNHVTESFVFLLAYSC